MFPIFGISYGSFQRIFALKMWFGSCTHKKNPDEKCIKFRLQNKRKHSKYIRTVSSYKICCQISSIFEKCPDRFILNIMTKPCMQQKTLFHWIRFNMGINFFWPPISWRLLEAKNTPQRQKWHEGVNLWKEVFNESCLATSKTP